MNKQNSDRLMDKYSQVDNVVQTERNMTNQITTRKRIGLIDFLKGMAMLAVVVDHSCKVLYTNPNIQRFSFYSVTLFVFLSGITTYLSMQSKNVITYDYSYVKKRIINVLIPYVVATGLSLIIINRFFDVGVFLKALVGFNTWGPYYFIVFFLQLVFISPVLFLIIKLIQKQKHKFLLYFFSVVIITYLSSVFTKFTYVVDVYTAGRMILGGSYFLVFYLGLLFASFKLIINTTKQAVTYSVIFIGLLSFFIIMYARQSPIILGLTNTLNFWQLNPPGVVLMVYATLVFGALGSFYCLCEKTLPQNLMRIFTPIEVCGKYSMTIFLYHLLFLSLGTQLANQIPLIRNNIMFYRITILFAMIVLPILGEIFITKLIVVYRNTLKDKTIIIVE